jgi:hypothetical protein
MCGSLPKGFLFQADKGWSLRSRRTAPLNGERPNSARSGRPANPIHDRLAETHFWHWLEEDPLDVHLVHLSQ